MITWTIHYFKAKDRKKQYLPAYIRGDGVTVQPSRGARQTMLIKRPLKDVGPWRGIFEPSTVTSFTERERVVDKHGLPGAPGRLNCYTILPQKSQFTLTNTAIKDKLKKPYIVGDCL